MNTVFETNFTVMPTDANYLSPLIFGGAFFSQMDLCAAQTANRALHDSTTRPKPNQLSCKAAITHIAEVKWDKPCYVGDLIFLRGEVVEFGTKSIVVELSAWREKRGSPDRDKVASGKFVFISIDNYDNLDQHPDLLPYVPHGLKMPEMKPPTAEKD